MATLLLERWRAPAPFDQMRGITFGASVFDTEVGRVEPDAEVHFAVLLYASVAEGETGVPRDELAQILWPESPLEAARHSLRQAMYRLRLLGIPVHLKGGRVILDELDTEIDLRDLLNGPVPRDDLLRIATQPFLPGYAPRLGLRFEAWVQDLRDRIDRVRRHALVEAVVDARTHARFRDIHKLARALLALDPLNETATLALAEALVMDGSKVEALRMLEEYEAEVGLVDEKLRLPARILRRRVSECLDDALLPRRFEVPFVGREAEFRELREGFVATRQGKGLCFVITGEPGIGKTRIANELLRLSVLDGAMVITYSCTSGDALTPLSSLLTLTQALLNQPGALGCASEHLQYLRRMHSPDPSSPSVSGGMAADIAYAQLVYSLAELTAAIADEGPLVVFVDDAHRLHQTSWRIFSDVVDRLPDKRVMLVFAARQLPEWYGSLGINGSDGRSRHVRLAAFSVDASRSFLDLWSEKNAVETPPGSAARVTDTAGGNPFYLGELLAHIARGGTAGEAPASIKGLVQLQNAALSKRAQRGLLVIALLQAHATIARVSAVLRLGPSGFVAVLDELETAGLVVSMGARVRLRHDLIGDVSLGLAPTTVLQYLRTRVAARLEREGRRTDSTELLSDALTHWERSESDEGAYRTSMLLGGKVAEVGLCGDALLSFERALAVAASPLQRSRARASEIRALAVSNNWDALHRLEETIDRTELELLSQDEADDVTLCLVEARMWSLTRAPLPGTLETVYQDTQRELNVRVRAAILAVIAADNDLVASAYLKVQGAALEQVAALPAREGQRVLLALLLAVCAGDRPRTLAITARYAELARMMGPGERVRSLRHAAHAMMRVGKPTEAIVFFEQSLRDAQKLRLPSHEATCLDKLVRLAYQTGDVRAALEYSRRLGELAHQIVPGDLYRTWACFADADAAMVLGDHERAQLTREQLERMQSNGQLCVEQQSHLFARTALAFAHPDLLDEATIAWCRGFPRGVLGRGTSDLAVISVVRALASVGDTDASRKLVRDYFSVLRVEDSPPAPQIWALLPQSLSCEVPWGAA